MDEITRAHYEGKFQVAFLTAKGDEFQTLFEKLMGKAHPADFIPCRPWGSAGDRKNDGYLPSEKTLFQVYAPNEMSAAEAIAKIDEDFKGALPHWAQYFEKWVFVHKAHDGLSPHIIAKLLELESQHPPLKLTHWSLEELRERLHHIPIDGLQSLFGFAPVGESALQAVTIEKLDHLMPSTLPFLRVRDVVGIFGKDDDPGAFSPSLREFEGKLVHRPALADQVQTALLDERFACLLGKGASGKTTLALLLAFSEAFGPEQSYYFDLAEADNEPDAAESYRAAMQAIARQHRRDALVIVDNIHLAEGLAHKLHLAWREAGQPVRLILQGRFTQQGADRRGRQSPLEELNRTALLLEVMREDLPGVLQRLVRRSNGIHSVATIPPVVLDQWLKMFGGELIAFSSAARRKLPQIVGGQYLLTEADAADYIREEYLENPDSKRRIESAERENLLAIAACADWELPVPAEALPHPPGSALTVSKRRGLVWQSTHGRYGQFARYRLCHPGMGKLLWFAAKERETNRLDQVCALAHRYPFFGCLLANRLARVQGDQAAAKRVLTSAVSNPDAFERLIEHGVVALHIKYRQLTGLGVMSGGEVDQKLVACKNLVDAALATPLHFLASFLQFAQKPMPKVWQALTDALAKHADRLSQNGNSATMDALVGFAHYAPKSLFEIAVREIKPGHWNSTPDSDGLAGATWLAWNCAKAKRDDLAVDMMTLLLRRANWRDFPPRQSAFAQACWLLANTPALAVELVEPFIKAVSTEGWLNIAYIATSCGQLASGLRQLALHQTVERCRQFHGKQLGWRLKQELSRFETAAPSEQSQVIQLLGCAGLCGWAVSQRSLVGITLGSVSKLPVSVLPHRPESAEVEDHQMQLWLGLRAFVSITWKGLPLARAIIDETLKLWRANLAETAATPATTAHRVNQSMVVWLEACSRANPPALVPSTEPLWTLAGFPLRLDMPNRPT